MHGPNFDAIGFRELLADGLRDLADGYRQLHRLGAAFNFATRAVAQNDLLGNAELALVRQADSRVLLAEVLEAGGRGAAGLPHRRRAVDLLAQAMRQSNLPERYEARQSEWRRLLRMQQARDGDGGNPKLIPAGRVKLQRVAAVRRLGATSDVPPNRVEHRQSPD